VTRIIWLSLFGKWSLFLRAAVVGDLLAIWQWCRLTGKKKSLKAKSWEKSFESHAGALDLAMILYFYRREGI